MTCHLNTLHAFHYFNLHCYAQAHSVLVYCYGLHKLMLAFYVVCLLVLSSLFQWCCHISFLGASANLTADNIRMWAANWFKSWHCLRLIQSNDFKLLLGTSRVATWKRQSLLTAHSHFNLLDVNSVLWPRYTGESYRSETLKTIGMWHWCPCIIIVKKSRSTQPWKKCHPASLP